jgi:cell division septal protein FtsQ
MDKDWFVKKILRFKTWLFGLGIGGVALIVWWIIKILICAFSGICLLP